MNKNINHLQGDLEGLKKNIHQKQQEGIQIYDDIQEVKSQIDEKIGEIYETSKELEDVKTSNDQLKREIEFLKEDIFQA